MKLAWIQRIFLMLLVAGSLFGAARNLIGTASLGDPLDDPVANWEVRFDKIRAQLPFVRGVIGYISDSDIPGAAYNAANDEGEYILTQYALAPIILIRGTGQEWNLANLSKESFELWRSSHPSGFELVLQQSGLYLLRRVGN